jgi:SPP1 gp7 family putative phage head morphogenesis protein
MDKARAWTDKELKHMEKRIRNIYVKSYNDIADKWLAYMERSAKRINTLQDNYDKAVKAGDIDKIAQTKEALYDAKMSQTFRSQYYKDMIDVTAQNITNVNQTATAYINGQLPKVASVNYNQLAEEADNVGVAFNLVDEHTVMKMIRDNDIKLPYKQLDPTKDIPWNTKKLNSAVLQGIVQGESMDKIAKRLMPIVGQNSTAAIRTARTCVTGAENAGRQASYKELASKGTVMTKVWIATGDERTRESHLELDGEEVPIDEPFSNDLMYPADPDVDDPAEVYNCRCSMRSHIIGFVDSKTGEIVEVSERAKTGHADEIEREKERRKEAKKTKKNSRKAKEEKHM